MKKPFMLACGVVFLIATCVILAASTFAVYTFYMANRDPKDIAVDYAVQDAQRRMCRDDKITRAEATGIDADGYRVTVYYDHPEFFVFHNSIYYKVDVKNHQVTVIGPSPDYCYHP